MTSQHAKLDGQSGWASRQLIRRGGLDGAPGSVQAANLTAIHIIQFMSSMSELAMVVTGPASSYHSMELCLIRGSSTGETR